MHSFEQELERLAARGRQGDPVALAELRHELELRLEPIVRRALRTQTGTSPLVQRVQAAARRLAPSPPEAAGERPRGFIGQVASSLRNSVLDHLRVRPALPCAVGDTVCGN
jgi:hypothetical protein